MHEAAYLSSASAIKSNAYCSFLEGSVDNHGDSSFSRYRNNYFSWTQMHILHQPPDIVTYTADIAAIVIEIIILVVVLQKFDGFVYCGIY